MIEREGIPAITNKQEVAMLKLFISQVDGKVQDATVLVRWCINQETVDELKGRKINDPYLLISSAPKGADRDDRRKSFRILAPLDQLMRYVQFRRPGENIISAAIVWGDNLYEYICRDGYGYGYKRSFMEDSPRYRPQWKELYTAEIEVVVPDGTFAKEPPAWEKKWVNMFFSYEAVDQCDFRRRRMFAYFIQPFLAVGFVMVVSLLIVFRALPVVPLLLIGARNIDFKSVYTAGQRHELIWRDVHMRDSLLLGPFIKFYERITHKKPVEAKEIPFDPIYAHDELLMCNGVAIAPDYQSLPARRKTFYLRFQNLKTKVYKCKPFAG